MAFQFRLHRVLAWYQKRCQLEEDRLRVILNDISGVETDIEGLRQSRDAIERSIVESTSIAASDFAALAGYRGGTRRDELAMARNKQRLEGTLAEQRSRVMILRTKIRLLEKLQERRLAEYVAEEQKQLEELSGDVYRAATFRSRQDGPPKSGLH
jgi:hypothetical protein